PPTPALSTLSLHDALPIWSAFARRNNDRNRIGIVNSQCSGRILRPSPTRVSGQPSDRRASRGVPVYSKQRGRQAREAKQPTEMRSEEHTSELQSRGHLVCR